LSYSFQKAKDKWCTFSFVGIFFGEKKIINRIFGRSSPIASITPIGDKEKDIG
jgi:hypothetical protein